MKVSFFEHIGVLSTDILLMLDERLAHLADVLEFDQSTNHEGLFIRGYIGEKKIIVTFRSDPRLIESASRIQARTALIVQTAQSRHPDLKEGDILLLDAQNLVYDNSLLAHLYTGFGVKKGYANFSPDSFDLRLLAFRVISRNPQENSGNMGQILKHVLSCTRANL